MRRSVGNRHTYRMCNIIIPQIAVIVDEGIQKAATEENDRRSNCHTKAILCCKHCAQPSLRLLNVFGLDNKLYLVAMIFIGRLTGMNGS